MTTTAKQQYEAALERADRLGVTILGRGHLKNHERFFLVASATSSHPHVVECRGADVVCDCAGAAHNRLCMHVAVVRRELEADAKATAEHIERVHRAMEEEAESARALQSATATLTEQTRRLAAESAEQAARRESAMLASRAGNKPITMWAS